MHLTRLSPERRELLAVALWVVAAHVLFALLVEQGRAMFPTLYNFGMYEAVFTRPHVPEPTALSPWQSWDAQHYLHLAEQGYVAGHKSIAFYPLWPALIRAGAGPLGIDPFWVAIALANALSCAACVGMWWLARADSGRAAADTALLLLLAWPGAMFLHMPYSEPLFLLLGLVGWYALRTRRWGVAIAVGVLLPLCRATGAFWVLPAAVAAWEAREARVLPRVLAIGAPVVGFGAYLAFMAAATGDPLSGVEAQREFISRREVSDLFSPLRLVRDLFSVAPGHGYLDSPLDRVSFVLALVGLWLARRERVGFAWALAVIVVPALTGFMSYTRYVVVAFPLFIGAGVVLSTERARVVRWLVLGGLLALQVLLALRFVSFRWAG